MRPDEVQTLAEGDSVIQSRLEAVLDDRGRSLYWLQQETGIAYTTLFRLRHNQASSVSFDVMNKICRVLECQPGDLFSYADDVPERAERKATGAKSSARKPQGKQAAAVPAG